MKINLGKGTFRSKLGSGFEKRVCTSHKEFLSLRIPLLLKIIKPIDFEKLSSHENKTHR